MENSLNLSPELLEKAKVATSAAALQALAQENGTPMTAEEAATCYAQLHPKTGALSDEELDNVAGGCGVDSPRPAKCKFCDHTEFTKVESVFSTAWLCDNCNKYA